MPQKTIQSYTNDAIMRLTSEVSGQISLLRQIKTCLPEGLAEHSLHCILKNHELVIFTDSGAWASQLRFYKDAILLKLKISNTGPITKLQVKVLSETTTATVNSAKPFRIPSNAVIAAIAEQSESSKQSEIKLALRKLSATLARMQQR
jgi:hypothetical protein